MLDGDHAGWGRPWRAGWVTREVATRWRRLRRTRSIFSGHGWLVVVVERREKVGGAASLAATRGGRCRLAFGRVEKKANRIEKNEPVRSRSV
jgi:hypothetical protein